MGPSEKSFNQVKAILNKLDQNIDQLRARRSHKPGADEPRAAPRQPEQAQAPQTQPTPAPEARPTPNSPYGQYGRATPIPPSFA